MIRIDLDPPRVAGRKAIFSWTVDPDPGLYRRSSFTVELPAGAAASDVPEAVWWRVALLCLHPHWGLLRPCRVRLSAGLSGEEAAFWERLIASEVFTLEALRGTRDVAPAVHIEDERGGSLPPPPSAGPPDRCAAAFSGGKDSLVQAALLSELSGPPLLVAATSPMPPLHDHRTPRRAHVLSEAPRRLGAELLEVRSDLRGNWNNAFATRLGYPIGVNEITDTFLYAACLLAAGAARGANRLFLASEAEVQENAAGAGGIVQHNHFMYSAATQRALDAPLRRLFGIGYGSLTWPLPSALVQEILWTRYARLADLEYSCWRVGAEEAACSRCSQCLRLSLRILALGQDPGRMGIDLGRLLRAMEAWTPRAIARGPRPVLPAERAARRAHRGVARDIRAISLDRMARALAAATPGSRLDADARGALRAFARLQRRLSSEPPGEPWTYSADFLSLVEPALRPRLTEILAEQLPGRRRADADPCALRSQRLTEWIIEPLGAAA